MVISADSLELGWVSLEDALEHLINELSWDIQDLLHGGSLPL
jgi:hypothetical protein